VKDRAEEESEQLNQSEVLMDAYRRKHDQATAARARLLATRKSLMLGRTANQTLAEQRRKVRLQNWFLRTTFIHQIMVLEIQKYAPQIISYTQ